jgi:uncharacterized protein YdhG (YjbR/CyaY superfamily)
MLKTTALTVDGYIAEQEEAIQPRLQQMREAILSVAPSADESISYMMPAYKLNGPLVYFGAFKNHIGFYPTASGVAGFKNELKEFTTSKGAIQFPHDKPLPIALIKKIVRARISENAAKMGLKKRKKK